MRLFQVIADPLEPERDRGPVSAIVVAKDEDEAMLLLRKDFNFTGYQLPPREMIPVEASHQEVKRVLGDAAQREKGVYRLLPTSAAPGT